MVSRKASEWDGAGTGASYWAGGQVERHVNGETNAVFERMLLSSAGAVFFRFLVHEVPFNPFEHC